MEGVMMVMVYGGVGVVLCGGKSDGGYVVCIFFRVVGLLYIMSIWVCIVVIGVLGCIYLCGMIYGYLNYRYC